MAKIENIKAVYKRLEKMEKRVTKPRVSVVVGYNANYALSVHERIEMKWKGLPRGAGFSRDSQGRVIVSRKVTETGTVGGGGKGFYWDPQGRAQAKFLEQPARELRRELSAIIETAVKNGATLEHALFMAGLRLQRESQRLVPVDTGNLKASAFTEKE